MKKMFSWRTMAVAAAAVCCFALAAPNTAVAEGNDTAAEITAGISDIELSAEEIDEIKAAADAGDAEAQITIGAFYYSGNGVAKDYAKAKAYLEKAAAQGNTDAMVILSGIYAQGLGVDQDIEKAINLLVEAAKNGNEDAQEALARLKAMAGGEDADEADSEDAE